MKFSNAGGGVDGTIHAVAGPILLKKCKNGHGKRYRVNIKFRDEKVYLGNMDHEMGYFLNNWNLIK